ncbi:hypothetical protein [Fodinicurvata sp. EGI_FJ10296]|uniref:hypothetical protein n=1 Tax=Fodinicurvata sp. EGI_FJ10296 TaxID=3231908 RepID=UPI003453D6B7
MKRKLSLVILACFFHSVAAADTVLIEPRIVGEQTLFEEQLRPSARISANRVVASVIAPTTSQSAVRPSVHLLAHDAWSGTPVCARWLSSDALYEAQATYDLPATLPANGVRLAYDSAYVDTIGNLTPERLGISVAKGECTEQADHFAPAIWNGDAGAPIDHIMIYLNSQSADDVYVQVNPPDHPHFIECLPLDHRHTVAMDRRCRIPFDVFDQGTVELELNAFRRGIPDDPIRFSVELPSP